MKPCRPSRASAPGACPLRHRAAMALAALALPSSACAAQPWPDKPVRVIVGFAPGGGTDIAARTVGQKLGDALGQTFVIDNRPGAGGTIGNALAARATPDGYTLLMTANGPHVIAPSLYRTLTYDVFRDFVPIALAASSPYVVVVHPSTGVGSVPELIAWLKARPTPESFGSAGTGTPAHLAGEMFRSMTQVRLNHVPYKGSAPAFTDLLAGQMKLMFADMPVAAPHLRSNRVKALAVTSAARSALAPDLPTLVEAGLAGYEATSWYGLLAPAGASPELVTRLNTLVNRALDAPDVRDRFATMGSTIHPGTPAAFAELIRRDHDRWAAVIRNAGVKLE